MAYFTPQFFEFFAELRQNNEREWYHANKDRFVTDVKIPFEAFVQEMINRLSVMDSRIAQLTPKSTIFRLYRDTRFSKDKTPYKTNVSAAIAPNGKKDMENPGIYFELNDQYLRIYSGVYAPEKEALWRVRYAISKHGDDFHQALNHPPFKKLFSGIQGAKNKRLQPEFKEAGEKEPLIFHKQFYYTNELPATVLLKDNLPQILIEHYEACLPINTFFQKALVGE